MSQDIIPLFINALTGNPDDLMVLADALEEIGINNTSDLRNYPFRQSCEQAQMLVSLLIRKEETKNRNSTIMYNISAIPKNVVSNYQHTFQNIDEKTCRMTILFDVKVVD